MKRALLFAAMCCLLLSCTKQEIPVDERIPINISVGQQTRANDSNFETNDKVGIYVVNYTDGIAGVLANSGNQANNMGFEYTGSAWSPEEAIYWKDKKTSADFYAYYPYSSGITDVNAHPFSVQADQSSEDNFWASDFLWGKAEEVTPTSSAVPIVTNHVLSRILVEINPGAGFTPESWAAATKSVKITGMKTAATINLSNGTATATGSAEDITPLLSSSTYKAMVIPQTVADNSKLVIITVDGTEYVYRKDYTFTANTQHKFSITVNRSSISVDISIGEWNETIADDNGTAGEEYSIPDNQIWYTADTQVDSLEYSDFGAAIILHDFDNGNGVITFDGNVTKIAGHSFRYNGSITNVTIPNSVGSIEVAAFDYCTNLTKFIIPSSVRNIEECAFMSCYNLSEITISEGVVSIGKNTFTDCTKLTRVTIPSTVTNLGTSIFSGCNSLIKFYGKYASPDGRCLIDESGRLLAFAPAGIENYSIPENVTSIEEQTFRLCENLISVNIPETVTNIGVSAFHHCISLKNVIIPTNVTKIEKHTFACCYGLENIQLHDGITYIGEEAFAYCHALSTITIPSKVTRIGFKAFNNCTNLSLITCEAVEPPTLDEEALSGIPENCILKVPAGCISKYEDSSWNQYFSNIEEIE